MACGCGCGGSKKQKVREAIRSGVRKALQEQKSENEVRSLVREALREILTEDDDYQQFVKSMMDMLNIDDPQDLTEEGREQFFTFLDEKYNANTDEAEEVSQSELADEFSADHFKSQSKVPDFLKKNEKVQRAARKVAQKLVNEIK